MADVQLPTITVTSTQATRLFETFGDADSYRKWLLRALRVEVIRVHTNTLIARDNEAREQELADFESGLPPAEPPVE